MKAKVKFDMGAIKGFFQEHGEKFVLVAGLIVMLLFIVSIFKQETLPANLQPGAIKDVTTQARANIERSAPPAGEIKPVTVSTASFVMPSGPWQDATLPIFRPEPTPFDDPNKRTDPTLFPILNLQAIGMEGAVALGGSGPDARAVVQPVPRGRGFDPSAPTRMGRPLDPSAPTRSRGPSAPSTRDPSAPTSRGGSGHAVAPQNGPSLGRPLGAAATPKALPGATTPLGTPADADAEVEKPIPSEMQLPGPPLMASTVEARPFVMLTGAIPWDKQLQEFQMRFAHAQKGESGANQNQMMQQQDSRDVPKYVWWRLERVDLTSGEEKKIIDFGDLDQISLDVQEYGGASVVKGIHPTDARKRLLADMKTWQNNPGEVVPPEYMDAIWLTWPLPPILLHDWGHEATNPLIPLTSPEAADAGASGDVLKGGDASKAAEPDAFTGQTPDAGATGSSSRPVMVPFSRGPRDSSAPIRGGSGHAMPIAGGSSRPIGPGAAVAAEDAPPVPYKLFRFTDFDVQPGHSYRYRVQLVLKNPNYGISADALANPNVKPDPYRDTPWSEFSSAASVPASPRLLATGIDRAKGKDAKGRVGILAWKKESGESAESTLLSGSALQSQNAVQLLDKKTIELGSVANFVKEKIEDVIDPSRHTRRDFTADLLTNAALLDVHGPETVETKPKPGAAAKAEAAEPAEPAEMLVLVIGQKGQPDQLIVTSQANDQPAVDTWVKSHKVPEELDNPPDNAATPALGAPRDPSAPTRGGPATGRLIPPSNGRTPRTTPTNPPAGRPTGS
jgi:hypothetical protein